MMIRRVVSILFCFTLLFGPVALAKKEPVSEWLLMQFASKLMRFSEGGGQGGGIICAGCTLGLWMIYYSNNMSRNCYY